MDAYSFWAGNCQFILALLNLATYCFQRFWGELEPGEKREHCAVLTSTLWHHHVPRRLVATKVKEGEPLEDPHIIISHHYAGNRKGRHIPPSWATVPFLRQPSVLHSAIIASQKGQSQSHYNIQPPFPNSGGPSGVGERGFAEVVGC